MSLILINFEHCECSYFESDNKENCKTITIYVSTPSEKDKFNMSQKKYRESTFQIYGNDRNVLEMYYLESYQMLFCSNGATIFGLKVQQTWQTFLWSINSERLAYFVLAKWGDWLSNVILLHSLDGIWSAVEEREPFCPMANVAIFEVNSSWSPFQN